MTRCRWDREQEAYLHDGEPCRTDDYGDPTVHCTARRSCANHIGHGELTCARCVGRARSDVRRIVAIAPLMGVQALGVGVNSEAANLAGPAADYGVFEARRVISRGWIHDHIRQSARDWCADDDCHRRHFKTGPGLDRWHKRGIQNAIADLLPDDDEHHPYSVLTRWEFMLREDYGQPRDDATSTTDAGAYLERTLHRMAQDDEQDFPLFAREMRACREHLESVLRNSARPERGAPCPQCDTPSPRLTLQHGHWCADEECNSLHFPEDPDRWVCPRNRDHWWTEGDYRHWVADVYEANRSVGA